MNIASMNTATMFSATIKTALMKIAQRLIVSPPRSGPAGYACLVWMAWCLIPMTLAAQPVAPAQQTPQQAQQKSIGCLSCHSASANPSMHDNGAVNLGCVDCHGGDASVERVQNLPPESALYLSKIEQAHVPPYLPAERGAVNRSRPEYIRFINPSDYRIARAACGACHLDIIKAAERSIMRSAAMAWGALSYNNGLLPYKRYRLGQAYDYHDRPVILDGPPLADPETMARQYGILDRLYPIPAWRNIAAPRFSRAFEDGGRNMSQLFSGLGFPDVGFPEIDLPNAGGQQQLQWPGKPDVHLSQRGPGSGARAAAALLPGDGNGDALPLVFAADGPGEDRVTACSACHVLYANDWDKPASAANTAIDLQGSGQRMRATSPHGKSSRLAQHRFTRRIPTGQCMRCHSAPANGFLSGFLGYTWSDIEMNLPEMPTKRQMSPAGSATVAGDAREPGMAVPPADHADHAVAADETLRAHGRHFRAVYKRDRDGNLLDKDNRVIEEQAPDKAERIVHMRSAHAEAGMQCVDCHFAGDNHGTGHLFGEMANAIEIDCIDCHGSAERLPNMKTSGPAALDGGLNLLALRNPDGSSRFEWRDGKLFQRSVLDPNLEWQVALVRNSVDASHPDYNEKAARAKLMGRNKNLFWGPDVPAGQRAHRDDNMECYTCHSAWSTGCGGCHINTAAGGRAAGDKQRRYTPQMMRDDMFMLGRRGAINGGRIAPVRSASALQFSVVNANLETLVMQQPPIAASGYSSQAFSPYFSHTVRKRETRTCSDCHMAKTGDNNAVMAQLLLYGTNVFNFVGHYAWVGGEASVDGVQVTEWAQPQAVIGSDLHQSAYPREYQRHQNQQQLLQTGHSHAAGATRCIQARGEYLYSANGSDGTQVFDIANIANNAFSQRIVTAPSSPLGHNTRIKSRNATCIALPSGQPIHPVRNQGTMMRDTNQERPFAPIYNYALITDAEEGLILVDVNTLADGDPRNNNLSRAATWNRDGILTGARHITLGGNFAYIIADAGLVILNLARPLMPELVSVLPLDGARSSALQFRYLWVTGKAGLQVVDVTRKEQPRLIKDNTIQLADARNVYLARTIAYVAAGKQGIAIVDITVPEKMVLKNIFTADGKVTDARDVIVSTTNASQFAYVAGGRHGLQVLQLTVPDSAATRFGFSPLPNPRFIARYRTSSPALALSRGLARDRGADETGGQIAVFGRIGSGPLSKSDMERLYLDERGEPWFVLDE